MAAASSINLGLPSLPETSDEELFYELVKVYNALNLLAQSTDTASNAASTAGISRGAKAISAATSTIAFAATEVVLVSATGNSSSIKVTNLNLSCNLNTVGVNGIDTGTMPIGFVALYVIYNPLTKVTSLLAKNTTGLVATSIYNGANMPSGYSYSGLVGIFPTLAVNVFKFCSMSERTVNVNDQTLATFSAVQVTTATVAVTALIPLNATKIYGTLYVLSNAAGNTRLEVYADINGAGMQWASVQNVNSSTMNAYELAIYTPSTFYYRVPGIAPAAATNMTLCAYNF